MKAIGSKIICMDKDFTSGQMVESMKVAISMTKKKASESILTQMDDVIEETGKMVNSMAKEYSSVQKVFKEKASGKTVRDYIGATKLNKIIIENSFYLFSQNIIKLYIIIIYFRDKYLSNYFLAKIFI